MASRPPIGEGPIAVTAYAIRALKTYAPPGRKTDTDQRLARASAWLRAQKAVTTEDRNMQLLGLLWAGGPASERARLARAILDKQRADGGWAQTDNLQSDAYATGVSLSALAEAGGIGPTHAAYQKGVQYLLSTQRADGSWYVKSRGAEISAVSSTADSLTATISGFRRWPPDGRPRRSLWRFRKIVHRRSSIVDRLV